MARSLYREWFVHFRFPGHEKVKLVDSELGKIPEGWEVSKVEALLKRVPTGKKYNQKAVSPTGRVPVLDQGKVGTIGYHDDEPGVSASESDPIIVFANHTCYQKIVFYSFSAIQNVLPFRPHGQLKRNLFWLHWATNGLVELNDYKGHWPEFSKKLVSVPPETLCARFGSLVVSKHLLIHKLIQKNEILRQTRDLLLPKLISGEIDVDVLDLPEAS